MLSDKPPPPDNPGAGDFIPKVEPPLPVENPHARNLPWRTAFDWLRAGWKDLWTHPSPSLLYGLGVSLVSALVVWFLYHEELDYLLFPALAGFMIVGPIVANGLYEKSRRIEKGEPVALTAMLFVRMRSGYQALFMGVMLLGLFLLWMRAAVLLYALFFGLAPFAGLDEVLPMLFRTPTGWGLLLAGSTVGALFAAFAFAISVFAVPMLLEERTDAMTAMGVSVAMVWNNLNVLLCWGAIVLALFLLSALTGLAALIIIFPLIGHATWHAYREIRGQRPLPERMFIQPA